MVCQVARVAFTVGNLFSRLAVVVLAFSVTDSIYAQQGPAAKLGQRVADFHLRDIYGRERSLGEFSDAKVVVLAFLGTECPLAKLYGHRLAELRSRYPEEEVAFLGIDSNRQDSLTELAAYARRHEINFPLLKDSDNQVADAVGAQRTPQVIVLDQLRTIRYVGAIDNQYAVGVSTNTASEHYLVDAIEELLTGKMVRVAMTPAVGCIIGRTPERRPTGKVTYTKDIAPILNSRCVECHREGEIGPFPLKSYDDVLGWEEMILEVVEQNRMPPWFADPEHGEFKNDARLSEREKQLLNEWVANGCPAGEEADLPTPPVFVEGWRIPAPDQVVRMRDEPFTIPAEGTVSYQYFEVDPQWDQDMYIIAAEARPGNREVVHHIIAYVVPPGANPEKDELRLMLVGYAPGSPPKLFEEGRAIFVPAGSKLLFELHYTPNGSQQSDLSYVGFRFTEKENVKELVKVRAALNHDFVIPPNSADTQVVADYKAKSDELLLRMSPHMHLRGKSFRYDAVFPDGQQRTLLNVPAYDFNWQLTYELAEPILLPKGTKVVCTAHYDNSSANLANPDPSSEVKWGQQSWEEMMIGFFDVVKLKKPR